MIKREGPGADCRRRVPRRHHVRPLRPARAMVPACREPARRPRNRPARMRATILLSR